MNMILERINHLLFEAEKSEVLKLFDYKKIKYVDVPGLKTIMVEFKDGSILTLSLDRFTNYKNETTAKLPGRQVSHIKDLFDGPMEASFKGDLLKIKEVSLSKTPQILLARVEKFERKQ